MARLDYAVDALNGLRGCQWIDMVMHISVRRVE